MFTLQSTNVPMWDKNRLDKAMKNITKTRTVVGRPTLQHLRDDQRWQTDAKLGSLLWCLCALW